MADEKLWEVKGKFVRGGVKEEFDNIYAAPTASKAKDAAMKDYNTYTRAGHEKKVFSKLTITSVESYISKK